MKSIFLVFFGLVLAIHCSQATIFDQAKRNVDLMKLEIKNSVTKINQEVNEIIQRNQKVLDAIVSFGENVAGQIVYKEVILTRDAAITKPTCLTEYNKELNAALTKTRTEANACFIKATADLKLTKTLTSEYIAGFNNLELIIDHGILNCTSTVTPIDYMICVTNILITTNQNLKADYSKAPYYYNQVKDKNEQVKRSVMPCVDNSILINSLRIQTIREIVKKCVGT